MDELEAQLAQLKAVKSEIADREKTIKSQKEAILEDAARFITDMGIDRLDGTIVSSVTVTEAKEPTVGQKLELTVSKKEADEFLLNAGLAVMVDIEKKGSPAKVRINKRKVIVPEVEGD